MQATKASSFTYVPHKMLGVSEPSPYNFGNQPNEKDDPAWTNKNWLKSRFHFSFAEYFNPHNSNFGALRVLNDDLVQPHRGFATHGHRDAEICTYILEGQLTHKDSTGTSETLQAGAIQFMTAGSGVRHSEHNNNPEPLRFIQMWLTPRTRGLTPNYGSSIGNAKARRNSWHHMVSDVENNAIDTDVKINADVNMYASELDPGQTLQLRIESGRQAYVLCIDGQTVAIETEEANEEEKTCDQNRSSTTLMRHDAAEIVGPRTITFQTSEEVATHLLVVEMIYDENHHGRGDL